MVSTTQTTISRLEARLQELEGTERELDRTREALRRSEARLRDISFSMADWIWEVNLDGVYSFAAGKVEEILGYRPSELIGRTPFTTMPEWERDRLEERFREAVEAQAPLVDIENWNVTKGGQLVCMLTNGVPVFDAAGELCGYRGVDKDITDRKRAELAAQSRVERLEAEVSSQSMAISLQEAERQRAEEQLRANAVMVSRIAETFDDIIWIFKGDDGGVLFVNPAYEAIFGRSSEGLDANPRAWMDSILPVDREKTLAAIELIEKSGSYEVDFRILKPNGELRWLRDRGFALRRADGSIERIARITQDMTSNKLAEQSMRESEKRFRSVFERAFDGLCVIASNGQLLDVNDAACRLLDRQREAMLSMSFPELAAREDRGRVAEAIELTLTQGSSDLGRLKVLDRRGQPIPVEIGLASSATTGRGIVIATVRDERERVRAEQARAESLEAQMLAAEVGRALVQEQELTVMFKRAAAAIVAHLRMARVEIWVLTRDGLELNAIAGAEGGLEVGTRCEASEDRLFWRLAADSKVRENREIAKYIDRGQACVRVAEIARLFSSYPLSVGDERLGVMVLYSHEALRQSMLNMLEPLAHQISLGLKRKRTELSLNQLALAIEQADESVMITDLDGIIQYVNPGFERITGYSRQEALGEHWAQILERGDEIENPYGELLRVITAGGTWKGQMVNRQKDGTIVRAEANVCPIVDQFGTKSGYLSVKHDVTARVQMQAQLRQSQKMEAIGTLAGGIAHDFNNILAGIKGYTQLAAVCDHTPDSEVPEYLEEVLRATDRAADLVKQILAFSRRGETQLKPVNLGSLVKEVLKLLRASLPSTIEVRFRVPSSSLVVNGDPTQMHQVLMNLCTNAYQAMGKKGGQLEVLLEEAVLEAEVPLVVGGELESGSFARLVVRDTGPGIPMQIIDRIFDPFFTTKGEGEGTGMGLAVVHGIISDHGGAISVESSPGAGATFVAYLPRIETQGARDVRDALANIAVGKGESILFVDDEEVLAELESRRLELLGYRVTVTSDSRRALEMIREDPKLFDLLITDQTMPGLVGCELAKQAHRLRSDLPVILCTGYADSISEADVRAGAIDKVLLKPFELPLFAEMIREVLDGSKAKDDRGRTALELHSGS